jgi:hypothetical protein
MAQMRASPGPTRRRFACWLFALLGPAAAAAPPEIEVRREAAVFVVRAEAELQADRRTAWFTVTDYEHLPRFVPGIRSTQVLARQADGGAERLLVEQSGEFRYLWLSRPVQVWLEVTHRAPEQVLARSVLPAGIDPERSTLRQFEGSYLLTAIDASRTRLVYRARFEPAQAMLPVLGTLAVRYAMGEQFRAMAAEIERRAALGRVEQVAR